MKKFLGIIIPIFLLNTGFLYGQEWLDKIDELKSSKSRPTFFQIQNEFYNYYDNLNAEKGKYLNKQGKESKVPGWKQFKRWEWEMEHRINPVTGEFPDVYNFTSSSKKPLSVNNKINQTNSSAWTNLGPNTSLGGYAGIGRLNCIAFHPSDNSTYWVGAPSGGIWKTTNNGSSWTPLTDHIDVIGVSNIIISSDYESSKEIFISTGDRDHFDTRSTGILKSTDGGITWMPTGLSFDASSGNMVFQLIMNPTNKNHLIATTYHAIYETTDGGINWTIINNTIPLLVDIKARPGDFTVLLGSTRYGDIYKSIDGGRNWVKKLDSNGGRTMIAVSPDDVNRIYAVSGSSGLDAVYRSDNGGETFYTLLSGSTKNILDWSTDGSGSGGQAWYDLTIEASPTDSDIVFIGGINTWRSTDGGNTWEIINHWYGGGGVQAVHADKHQLRYRNNGDLFEANDGGIYISQDDGDSWIDKSNGIINSQMYKIGVSQTQRGKVITGLQDNGTKLINSNNWQDIFGGDGMECIIDYSDAEILYGELYYGRIRRRMNGITTTISNNIAGGTLEGAWVTPYIIDENDPNTLYVGYKDVWKTTDRGDSFQRISTFDSGSHLRSMAIAPSNSNYIYIAEYRKIKVTKNGGGSWQEISSGLPLTNSITSIAVDHINPEKLWVTLGQFNDKKIFESDNGGSTWRNISNGLPDVPVYSIVQRKLNGVNQLYAGTDIGVYVKVDNNSWESYSNGLPNVWVSELGIYYDELDPNNSRLIAGTYGRGLWESPLLEVSTEPLTYVPDDNFEQALIDLGFDDVMDDYVNTNSIAGIENFEILTGSFGPIEDLTGLEDFTALKAFTFWSNNLTSIDLSKNLLLERLEFFSPKLNSINISNNLNLKELKTLEYNELSTIDVSNNIQLTDLFLSLTPLNFIDVSSNTNIINLHLTGSYIHSLDISENLLLENLDVRGNSNLDCIQVNQQQFDNIPEQWKVDENVIFSLNCNAEDSTTFVPDDNFEQVLIDLGLDDVLDDYVVTANIQAISQLNVKDKNISDLTGIEDFVELTWLDCSFNNLNDLNIVSLTKLESLYCTNNNLSTLNVSNNSLLFNFNCYNNQLTELNVTKNLVLDNFNCYNNNLTSIDVSANSLLKVFDCSNNQLSALDLSKNVQLQSLNIDNNNISEIDIGIQSDIHHFRCQNNQLTTLDVSQNTSLNYLNCVGNLITCIQVNQWQSENVISGWDKDATAEFSLQCIDALTYIPDDNFEQALIDMGYDDVLDNYVNTAVISAVEELNIDNKDISDLTGIEGFGNLKFLRCANNQISTIDISNNKLLEKFYCSNNNLTEINIKENKNLYDFKCQNNQISHIDISENNLTIFSCANNLLTDLDLSKNVFLRHLYINNNQLTHLDVSNNFYLQSLFCGLNQLTSLDVINNIQLEKLGFEYNSISDIDLSNNINLELLSCGDNPINNLDIKANVKLEYLHCSNIGPHSSIDLSQNVALSELICRGVQLENLDLSKNKLLTYLDCTNNNLTYLDVSSNSNLEFFSCQINQLTHLDLFNNTLLSSLGCGNNLLTNLILENNTMLSSLGCNDNLLTGLDLKHNTLLTSIVCENNQLTSLNVRNGNNSIIYNFRSRGNPDLTCVDVDNPDWSSTNWTNIDPQTSFSESCNPDRTYIPDDNFEQALIDLGYDNLLDDFVLTASINTVQTLDLKFKSIADLTGIEDFSSLTWLDCSFNELTSLNLSNQIELESLYCTDNLLESLNVANCSLLINLNCYNNKLTFLDVSNNLNLDNFNCYNNQLSSLDIQANTLLKVLDCNSNQISSLDLNNNNLQSLNIDNNLFEEINVDNQTNMHHFRCMNNKLTELDVSTNSSLNYVNSIGNQLLCIQVSQYQLDNRISSWDEDVEVEYSLACGPSLTYVPDDNFEQRLIDLGYDDVLDNYVLTENIKNITELDIPQRNISDLTGIEDFSSLTKLNCQNNQLTSLDVSGNIELVYLWCWGNKLTSLDLSNNHSLFELIAYENQLSSINLGNINIERLFLHGNQFSSLDLSTNTSLTYLDCRSNLLNSIDLSNNLALTHLVCSDNQFNGLNLTSNTLLSQLTCINNQLENLDLSNNVQLQYLDCRSNNLTSLDLSNNIALTTLFCSYNGLSELNTIEYTIHSFSALLDANSGFPD